MINNSEFLEKKMVVGVNFFDVKDELIEQFQTHGVIAAIDEQDFLHLKLDNGQIYKFPFSLDSVKKATPGIYRERSTGIEVEDPDYICQFRINGIVNRSDVEKYKSDGFSNDWRKY